MSYGKWANDQGANQQQVINNCYPNIPRELIRMNSEESKSVGKSNKKREFWLLQYPILGAEKGFQLCKTLNKSKYFSRGVQFVLKDLFKKHWKRIDNTNWSVPRKWYFYEFGQIDCATDIGLFNVIVICVVAVLRNRLFCRNFGRKYLTETVSQKKIANQQFQHISNIVD